MTLDEKSCYGRLALETTVGVTSDNDDVAGTAGVNCNKAARGHNT